MTPYYHKQPTATLANIHNHSARPANPNVSSSNPKSLCAAPEKAGVSTCQLSTPPAPSPSPRPNPVKNEIFVMRRKARRSEG